MSNSGKAPMATLLVVVAVLGVGALLWLLRSSSVPPFSPVPAPPPPTVAGRPECPTDSIAIAREDTTGTIVPNDTAYTVPLSGVTDRVREYHDCQAFVDSTETQYVGIGSKSLFAIFAPNPDTLDSIIGRAWSGRPARRPPRPSTRVAVQGQTPAMTAFQLWEQQTFKVPNVGIPFATIHDFGNVWYQPLGIFPGFNCLYVYADVGGGLHGSMVHQGRNEDCRATLTTVASGAQLDVRFSTDGVIADSSVPAVARWDWDPARHQQYAGFKCGPAWCEVGAPGFSSSPGHAGLTLSFEGVQEPVGSMALGPVETSRTLHIKGWYDEQRLAYPDPTTHTLRPSGWATIYPNPALGRMTTSIMATTSAPSWSHVAIIQLPMDFPGEVAAYYAKKLNYYPGMNNLYLCWGDRDECRKVDAADHATPVPASCQASPLSAGKKRYWARVVSAKGTRVIFCIVGRPYPGTIPGDVRWRWSWTDDINWVRCPSGCCELQ